LVRRGWWVLERKKKAQVWIYCIGLLGFKKIRVKKQGEKEKYF